ncbi:uncharacterized protein ACMZJ9_015370 [Mantella aurantiaca]
MTMDYDKNNITERIIKLTLRILHLLFEEDYIIETMSGSHLRVNSYSDGWPGCRTPEKDSYKKILKVIQKIVELLTGEVPIRCQDVTVYFSMEEWEYIEGHKYLYHHTMVENQQPLTLTDPRITDSTCQSHISSQYGIDEDDDTVISTTRYSSAHDQMADLAKISTQYEDFPHLEKHTTTNSMNGMSRNSKKSTLGMGKIKHRHMDHTYAFSYEKSKALFHKPVYQPDLNLQCSSSGTQYSAGDKKEESPLREEEHLPPSDIPSYVDSAEYMTVSIKEDPYICKEEEHFPHVGSSTSEEYYQGTSTLIKEETSPCQEFPQYSSTYTSSAPVQYNFVHIKEEPIEEEVPAEIEFYVDETHCLSDYPKKPDKSKLNNSEELPLSCNVCGKHFKQKSGLGRHRKIHVKVERYTCHDCGKSFLSLKNLKTHQKIHTEEKPYSCGECGKRFSKVTNLSNHKKIHATKNPFSCAKCGKQFVSNSNLRRHQKKHDGDVETTEFSSSECSKRLIDKHELCPPSEKPYSCTDCGRRFIKRINLVKHQRLHTRKNLHYCQECGKYFMSKAYLLRHIDGHSKKRRPCSCQLCGKCFHNKLDLTIHQRIHKGEKPSITSEWRKSFIRKLGVVIQERSNVGEKPYTCPECGEQFEKKLQLLRHEKTHIEEKPFSGCVAQGAELTRAADVDAIF